MKNNILKELNKIEISIYAKYLYINLLEENTYDEYTELTNEKVREILSVSNKTAVKILKELVNNKLLTKSKINKNTNYFKIIYPKVKREIRIIKQEKALYKKIEKENRPFNYDWLKASYERFSKAKM